MIPLLLVWLRAAGLLGQAVALGGAVFAMAVVRRDRVLVLAGAGALLAALAQLGTLAALSAELADARGWPVVDLLRSTVGVSAMIRIACAVLVAVAAFTRRGVFLVIAALALSLTGTLATHAVGWVGSNAVTLGASVLHQAGAGVWIGGLLCATALALRPVADLPDGWLRPFSAVAVASVVTIAVSGAALSWQYIAGPAAAVGTAYGAMVLTKAMLFGAMIVLGAASHRALRRAEPFGVVSARRLEVEAGLAIVVIFLAASIAGAPPAVDVGADRATLAEIRTILTPRWPSLDPPSLAQLAASTDLGNVTAARSAEETAWSEFGHHGAGIFIVVMGVLAMLERTGRAPWARHWPLLFLGLTVFVGYNMDPEGWQTGNVPFWRQLLGLEVLQHRILLAFTAVLGIAEWRVRSGRSPDSPWRYVFPLVFVVSGIVLLSHAHELNDAKSSFLMELTHLPMGLVVLVAGWTRWLELRLPSAEGHRAGRWWGPSLVALGVLLIFYREG